MTTQPGEGVSDTPPPGLLKIGAVARQLSVTPQSIREWVKEGRLACYTSPGGTRLFDPAEVERFTSTWRRPQRIYQPRPLNHREESNA